MELHFFKFEPKLVHWLTLSFGLNQALYRVFD